MSRKPFKMQTYLVLFNGLVLCVSFALTFLALDWYLRKRNQETIDHDLQTYMTLLLSDLESADNTAAWPAIVARFGFAHGISNALFQVLDNQQQPIISSDVTFWSEVIKPSFAMAELEPFEFRWQDVHAATMRARLIYYRIEQDRILRVGINTQIYAERLRQTRVIFFSGALFTVLLAGLLSFLTTRRAIRAVDHVTVKAKAIREHDAIDETVSLPTGLRETDELALTFNKMMARIHHLMDHQKTMMDHFAHDLKTPITRLRGLGEEVVRTGAKSDPHFAGIVVEECDRMHELLESLLEVTSADAGVYPWKWQHFDMATLVLEAADLFSPLLENKGLDLVLDLPQQLQLHNDPRVCQRIVGNLLENAIKYTDQGSVKIQLERWSKGARLVVSDSGIGIAKDDIKEIFEPFFRVDRSRGVGGNGLGLSFCNKLLGAMGGSIECRSQQGEGTVFEVLLPHRNAS